MSEEKQVITNLRMLQDILTSFTVLVSNLHKTSKKYGLPLSDIKNFDFSRQESRDALKSLPPEKLGMLIGATSDLSKLQEGLADFMNYDAQKLADFGDGLQSITKKLNGVLQEPRTRQI